MMVFILVSHFTPLLWCYPRTLRYRTYCQSSFGPLSWFARTIHCQVSFLPSHLCYHLLSLRRWRFVAGLIRTAACTSLWARCPLWLFLALKAGFRSSTLFCLDFVDWTHQRTCVCTGRAIVSRMSLSSPWRQRRLVGDLTKLALPSGKTLKLSFLVSSQALCDTKIVHDGTKQAPCSCHTMKSRLGICRSVGRLWDPLGNASRDCLVYHMR